MSKKILIVEESLRDLKAHWFEYIKTITTAAEADNWQVDVASHRDVANEIKKRLTTFPIFHHAYYLDSKKKKLPGWRYYGFVLHSLRCLKVLFPFLKQQTRYDEIFVPTVLVHHLIAWWAIANFHSHAPKHLTLFFVTNPGIWHREQQQSVLPKSSFLQGWLLKLFAPLVQQGKVTLAVETKGAKQEFEQLTGLPFRLLPHPVPEFNIESATTESLNFACYGFARYEKGSDLLKKAISQILNQQPNFEAQFRLQWVEPFTLPDGSICQPDNQFCQFSQVSIINRPLMSDDYHQLLQDTKCMILPYRNSSYHARVSRVAIEAVCLGIPIIYTKGGWLEEIVTEFGAGIGIEDKNIVDLTKAIVLMSANCNEYLEQAMKKKQTAQKYFSGQNFFNLLTSYPSTLDAPVVLNSYSSSVS